MRPSILAESGTAEFFGEELVHRLGDRFLAEVEVSAYEPSEPVHRQEDWRVRDALLADVVAGRLAPVVDASVVDALRDATAHAASEQAPEEVRVPAATPRPAGVADRAVCLDGLLSAPVEVGADQRRV